jgi:two-component system, OmpR family, sensor kinase
MIRRIILCLIPSVVCLGAMIGVETLAPNLPVLMLRISAGWVLLMVGLLTTVLITSVFALRWWERIHVRDVISKERQTYLESRHRFFRRLDHELKNPLTGIRAAIANLEETDRRDSLSATLPDIRRQVDRMVRLTSDLRKLADLDDIPLELSEVDLGTLLEGVVETLRAQSKETGRDFRLIIPCVPWPLPLVNADADMLNLAFHNLIGNAFKYSRPQDTIEVRASERDHFVQVEIADSGPGIPGEELPRIFEELYRGSNARGSEGSGLGLALVRRIVERHGGSISVRSRMDLMPGTVFAVLLPFLGYSERVTKR